MKKAVILFRKNIDSEEEIRIAAKYFEVYESRVLCGNSYVIGRYSVLPYYKELQTDLEYNSCKLVNSYQEHKWIADFTWYNELIAVTPTTWFDKDFYLSKDKGPFVVKGRTNSRKEQWNKLMYAETRQDALQIASLLSSDPLISQQGIVYRKYIPLKTFEIGINDLPFTNEWRFFFFRDRMLTYGYYWSIADDHSKAEMTVEGVSFARKCAQCACHYCEFYTLDIAERADGGWVLIEINDGQMAGLSNCNPEVLYFSLKQACKDFIED